MAKMTSRQRMLAAIRHEPVDRVPVAPWHLGRIAWDSPLGAELVARCDPWIECGLGGDPFLGSGVMIERGEAGADSWRVIHAGRRDLRGVFTTTAQTTAATEYPCKTLEDIEALLAIPYSEPPLNLSHWRTTEARLGEDGLVCVGVGTALCYPNDYLGTEYCSLLWASDPEVIRRIVATAAERVYAYIERACHAGVQVFRLVGGEYATQLMGRRAWEELVVPYDKPLIELIQCYGGIAHYHNHGNMQHFIDDIGALGVDVATLYTLVFALGAALAGLAGAMVGAIQSVQVGMGEPVLILAFVVIVIGGIGSIKGALVGAILVGVVDTMGRFLLPQAFGLVMNASQAGLVGGAIASMLI